MNVFPFINQLLQTVIVNVACINSCSVDVHKTKDKE